MEVHDGFIKMNQSVETLELIKRPNEFTLLALIAIRAKHQTDFSIKEVRPGEALIGDYSASGLTERKYRTAKKNLEKWGFITTKATSRGTIVKLIKTSVFDIYIEPGDKPNDRHPSSMRQTSDKQATTNKIERSKERKEESVTENEIDVKTDQTRAIEAIIGHLNKKTNGDYRPNNYFTQTMLNALFELGYTTSDCIDVINVKYDQWHDIIKLRPNLRPKTLFSERNFESYLKEAKDAKEQSKPIVTAATEPNWPAPEEMPTVEERQEYIKKLKRMGIGTRINKNGSSGFDIEERRRQLLEQAQQIQDT